MFIVCVLIIERGKYSFTMCWYPQKWEWNIWNWQYARPAEEESYSSG